MWILYGMLFIILVLFAIRQIAIQRAELLVNEMVGVEPWDEIPPLVQIRNLKAAGILFRTGELEQECIMDCSDNDYYAAHPYYALLTDAGARGMFANVYGITDRECIYDSEYGEILKGLGDISGLEFTDIRCPDRHRVCWKMNGRKYTWRGKKQRDWADHRIADYLNRFCRGDERFFTDNTHEGIIYFYGTGQRAEGLNTEFGLKFQ